MASVKQTDTIWFCKQAERQTARVIPSSSQSNETAHHNTRSHIRCTSDLSRSKRSVSDARRYRVPLPAPRLLLRLLQRLRSLARNGDCQKKYDVTEEKKPKTDDFDLAAAAAAAALF